MVRGVFVDLGQKDYQTCWDLQHRVHQARVENRLPDCLLLVEHSHVLTLGRKADPENVLMENEALRNKGISVLQIERGGDVTYHGPGQLVGYPIFSLERGGGGVIEFIGCLEEVMIRTLKDYGIPGERNERNRGAWVGEQKIGFVGVAVRKGITFHGFALNVAPDLFCFDMINPCGLREVQITSMAALLEKTPSMNEIKERVVHHLAEVFGLSLNQMEEDSLSSMISPPVSPLP